MISGTSFLGKGRGALHEKGLTLLQENMFPVNIHRVVGEGRETTLAGKWGSSCADSQVGCRSGQGEPSWWQLWELGSSPRV